MAILTKLIGCGLPSLIFLKNKGKACKVGIGMISRGEVGLIVAGVGVTSGAFYRHLYCGNHNGSSNYNYDSYLA
jgi:Kef-type K+ transport system membrane component KefB